MEEDKEIGENIELLPEVLDEVEKPKRYDSQKTQKLWGGTWNNPDMSDEELNEYLKSALGTDLQYYVFQREIAPDTGTVHIQWFIILLNRKNFNFVKGLMPYGTHIFACDGTAIDNRNYCTKTDSRFGKPYEDGDLTTERQRTDIKNIVALAKGRASDVEITELYPSQTFQGLRKIQEMRRMFIREEYSKRCRNVEVYFYFGATGTRKTTRILKEHGLENCFVVDNYGSFMFDGYEHQSVIILDEYEGQEKMITKLNKILEPFPLKLNLKGSTTQACFEKVYFVSNFSFDELYKDLRQNNPKLYNAFYRRIHHIIEVDEHGRERKLKQAFFEDIPDGEIEFEGLTKRISRVVTYNHARQPTTIWQHAKPEQLQLDDGVMLPITPEEEANMPF